MYKISLRDFAFKCLARHEYSVLELTKKLQEKYPDKFEDINVLITEFIDNKWLSDERYCESCIYDAVLITKSGPQKILQKLIKKGIPSDYANEMIEQYYPHEKQIEIVHYLIQKKESEIIRRSKSLDKYQVQQKLIQFLIGKGFSYDVIKKLTPL